MKNLILLLLILAYQETFSQTSPDYIFSDDHGSGFNWITGTLAAAGPGGTYKWQFQANTTANHYFKFGETSAITDGSGFWMNNAAGDVLYNTSGAASTAYYYANLASNGRIYFAVTSGKYYVIKSRKDAVSANSSYSVMELSGAPVTISGVTDNYSAVGNPMTVKIFITGSKPAEERIFVRYTTDNWTTSAITAEATLTGFYYSATIPGGGVTATADNKYYVFTTTVANPSVSDADLLTINYFNNSGNYYRVFSKAITVNVQNIQMGYGPVGPWTFNQNSLYYFEPQNSFCNNTKDPVSAYVFSEWNTTAGWNSSNTCGGCNNNSSPLKITTSSCIVEQSNVLNNTAGVTLFFNRENLSIFKHINTVNPANDWATVGQAGDYRVYSGNGGNLKVDGNIKLAFSKVWTSGIASYPPPVGAGSPITMDGWAIIDRANSDPLWVEEFDPYGTGHVEFQGTSESQLVQVCYGYYNWTITVTPSLYQSFMYSSHSLDVGLDLSFAAGRVNFNFSSKTGGGPGNILDTVTVKYVKTTPGGSLPGTITKFAPVYWQLGTVLSAYNAALTFDLADIGGINTPANLRILRRENSSAAWSIVTDYTLIDATHIKANNVTNFGDWTIGTTGSDPLPVDLVSFTGRAVNNNIELNWITATEVNSYGFEIERCRMPDCNNPGDWKIVGFVQGNGNSNSIKKYQFVDKTALPGENSYRLRQMDCDGQSKLYDQITVSLSEPDEFKLLQNSPNPFNPITAIKFHLPVTSLITIQIFDEIGREVTTLVDEEKPAGAHIVYWNGKDDRGNQVAGGVYLYRLTAGSFVDTKKMNYVK